jgi:hypothetical protein
LSLSDDRYPLNPSCTGSTHPKLRPWSYREYLLEKIRTIVHFDIHHEYLVPFTLPFLSITPVANKPRAQRTARVEGSRPAAAKKRKRSLFNSWTPDFFVLIANLYQGALGTGMAV